MSLFANVDRPLVVNDPRKLIVNPLYMSGYRITESMYFYLLNVAPLQTPKLVVGGRLDLAETDHFTPEALANSIATSELPLLLLVGYSDDLDYAEDRLNDVATRFTESGVDVAPVHVTDYEVIRWGDNPPLPFSDAIDSPALRDLLKRTRAELIKEVRPYDPPPEEFARKLAETRDLLAGVGVKVRVQSVLSVLEEPITEDSALALLGHLDQPTALAVAMRATQYTDLTKSQTMRLIDARRYVTWVDSKVIVSLVYYMLWLCGGGPVFGELGDQARSYAPSELLTYVVEEALQQNLAPTSEFLLDKVRQVMSD